VIVCENEGATWLPFEPFRKTKANESRHGHKVSAEAIYVRMQAIKPLATAARMQERDPSYDVCECGHFAHEHVHDRCTVCTCNMWDWRVNASPVASKTA
jgi:hypothetical protein